MADLCPYCGAELEPGQAACAHHDDLPGLEIIQICTNSDDCQAPPDGHFDDCPVEHQLRETFGY